MKGFGDNTIEHVRVWRALTSDYMDGRIDSEQYATALHTLSDPRVEADLGVYAPVPALRLSNMTGCRLPMRKMTWKNMRKTGES